MIISCLEGANYSKVVTSVTIPPAEGYTITEDINKDIVNLPPGITNNTQSRKNA